MSFSLLIVDDSPIVRAAIRKVALMTGIEASRIHLAGNGEEALAVLESAPIDLVLLDLNMPVMNGEAFVERVHERPEWSDLVIVIVSTESNRERLERMRQLGVSESLHKPFEPEALGGIIGRTMGVSR